MFNLFRRGDRPRFCRVHRIEHRPGLGHRCRHKVYAPFNAVEWPDGSVQLYWGDRRSFSQQRRCPPHTE